MIGTRNQVKSAGAREQIPHRAIRWAFEQIVRAWPCDSRDWAIAMQAELGQIESSQESLQWLAGGVMSLGKAWWNRVFYGDEASKENSAPVKKPGVLAALTLIAALAVLFLPTARQGLSAVLGSWRPNQPDIQHGQLMSMARVAESQGDAKTIAFAALHSQDRRDFVTLSTKAVAMDPSLTWLFAQGYYFVYHMPETRDWPAKLQAWDPGNAVGYLVEAEVRDGELNPDFRAPWDIARRDPQWLDDGRKAVEAPRYDTYRTRRLLLDHEVFVAHGVTNPELVGEASFRMGWPNTSPASVYSKRLLAEAKLALERGDKQTAKRNAWIVAHFGEMLRAYGGTENERFWSFEYRKPAFEILQPILAAEGQTEEAAMLGQEIESMRLRYSDANSFWSNSSQARIIYSSLGMNLGTAFAVFSSMAIFFAGLLFIAAKFSPDLSSGSLYRIACRAARYSPMGLLISLTVLAVSYWPTSEAVRSYLERPTDSSLRGLTEAYFSVSWVSDTFRQNASSPSNHSLFWAFVILAGLFTIALIIGRNVISRTPRAKIA